MKGERRLNFYRQLKSLHNVVLVSPSVDSHELIERADVVVTITGSSAWEAILYEKPVIALGPLCYGFYDLVYRCGGFSALPGMITQAIEGFRPDHELLLEFVTSFLHTAHSCAWGDPVRMPQIRKKENIRRVAQAIVSEAASRMADRSLEMIPT